MYFATLSNKNRFLNSHVCFVIVFIPFAAHTRPTREKNAVTISSLVVIVSFIVFSIFLFEDSSTVCECTGFFLAFGLANENAMSYTRFFSSDSRFSIHSDFCYWKHNICDVIRNFFVSLLSSSEMLPMAE